MQVVVNIAVWKGMDGSNYNLNLHRNQLKKSFVIDE